MIIYADPYVELSQNLESSCPNVYLAIVIFAPLKNHGLSWTQALASLSAMTLEVKASYTDNLRGYALSTPKTHQQWWSQSQIWYSPFHQRSSHFQPKPGDFSSKHFIQCLAGETLGDSACSHGRQAGPSGGGGGGGGGGSSSSSSSGDASSSPLSDAALGAEDETGELDIFGFRPFSWPFLGARKRVAKMFIQRYHISQIRWIPKYKTDQNCQNVIIFREISNRVSVRLPNRPSSMLSAGVWSKCPASSAPPKLQSRRTARHLQTSSPKCWWTPPPCPRRRRARGLANRTAGPSQPGPWWRRVAGILQPLGVNFCG